MTSKNLPWHGLTAQLFLKLLITQHEVPFINTSEATKRSSNRTENGKCTAVTNRRSRVGLSTPIYTNHRQLFSLSRIFTDLITHNYQSNQSALMTRGPFLERPGNFSGPKSHRKISNLAITEQFYSQIFNMKRSSLHTRSFRCVHFFVFRYR